MCGFEEILIAEPVELSRYAEGREGAVREVYVGGLCHLYASSTSGC